MTDWIDNLPGLLAGLVRSMRWIAAIAFPFLAAVTIVDVIGRNTGLFGVTGILEITFFVMITAGTWALPHCFVRGEHIVVDVATQKLPERINRSLDCVWLVVGGLFLGVLAWLTWHEGAVVHATGQRSQSLEWSPLVFHLPAVFGYGVVALTAIVAASGFVRRRANPDGAEDRGGN